MEKFNANIELLSKILVMKDTELVAFLMDKFDDIETDCDNYIYVKGNSPLCLVAHIDTVRSNDNVELEIQNHIIRNKNGILGADDRAGVYILLELYEYAKKHNLQIPHLLFSNYEESGGKGVSVFCNTETFRELINNVTHFIEYDRKGCSEYVEYVENPEAFKKYIESFGYIEDFGSFSDVSTLSDESELPSVNLSTGYYHQHTQKEYLHIQEMELNIERGFMILKNPFTQKLKCQPKYYGYYRSGNIRIYGFDDKDDFFVDSYLTERYNKEDDIKIYKYDDLPYTNEESVIVKVEENKEYELLNVFGTSDISDYIKGVIENVVGLLNWDTIKEIADTEKAEEIALQLAYDTLLLYRVCEIEVNDEYAEYLVDEVKYEIIDELELMDLYNIANIYEVNMEQFIIDIYDSIDDNTLNEYIRRRKLYVG